MIIRFAVLGLGHIGRRHAALIAAHPEAVLVAACDPAPPADRPEWLRGVPLFPSLSELLERVDCDVVCICTPNGLHARQAIDCLAAGRNVLIEKPMALTVADCEAIIEAAHRYDRQVFGVMQNRYSPASAWLHRTVGEGSLGRILQVHLDCYWNRDARYYLGADGTPHPWHGDEALDGGVLFTQFAHFVDLLCWTFGRIAVTAARFANQTHRGIHSFADTGMVHLKLGDGAIGSLNFSTAIWDRNFESTLTVIGSEGTVKLGGQYMNELRYCHVRNLPAPALPPTPPANDYGGYNGSAANHHYVIDNVIDVLNGRAAVATTAEQGREVVRLIREIYAASEPV